MICMLDIANLDLEEILHSSSRNGAEFLKKSFCVHNNVQILSSPKQILDAFKLRYDVYQQTPFRTYFSNPKRLLFSEADLSSILLGYYNQIPSNSGLELNSRLLGTLSLDIGCKLKSEKLGLDLSSLRDRGVSLAELHSLGIDKSVCRRAFKPLFDCAQHIGTYLRIESYIMVMREELTKLYRNFDKIEIFNEFDSFMGIHTPQKVLLYTPTNIKILGNDFRGGELK